MLIRQPGSGFSWKSQENVLPVEVWPQYQRGQQLNIVLLILATIHALNFGKSKLLVLIKIKSWELNSLKFYFIMVRTLHMRSTLLKNVEVHNFQQFLNLTVLIYSEETFIIITESKMNYFDIVLYFGSKKFLVFSTNLRLRTVSVVTSLPKGNTTNQLVNAIRSRTWRA